jgi:hypothetical protein
LFTIETFSFYIIHWHFFFITDVGNNIDSVWCQLCRACGLVTSIHAFSFVTKFFTFDTGPGQHHHCTIELLLLFLIVYTGHFNCTWPIRGAVLLCHMNSVIIWYRVVSPQVDSPGKVSRFVPLNRYYIIIDEVFFCQFFGNYLFISCMQKKIIT